MNVDPGSPVPGLGAIKERSSSRMNEYTLPAVDHDQSQKPQSARPKSSRSVRYGCEGTEINVHQPPVEFPYTTHDELTQRGLHRSKIHGLNHLQREYRVEREGYPVTNTTLSRATSAKSRTSRATSAKARLTGVPPPDGTLRLKSTLAAKEAGEDIEVDAVKLFEITNHFIREHELYTEPEQKMDQEPVDDYDEQSHSKRWKMTEEDAYRVKHWLLSDEPLMESADEELKRFFSKKYGNNFSRKRDTASAAVRLVEEHDTIHNIFMKKIEKCITRPSSAAKLRPHSARSAISSANVASSTKRGPLDVSDPAFVRPATSPKHAANTSFSRPKSAGGLSQPPREKTIRPFSAPASKLVATGKQPVKSEPIRPKSAQPTLVTPTTVGANPETTATPATIEITADQATVVKAYFSRKINNAKQEQDISHYQLMVGATREPTNWNKNDFSVNKFIKTYLALAKDEQIRRQQIQSMALPDADVERRKSQDSTVRRKSQTNTADAGAVGIVSKFSTSEAPKHKESISQTYNRPMAEMMLFHKSIQKAPFDRNHSDIKRIFTALRPLRGFKALSDFVLGQISSIALPLKVDTDRVVFKQGDPATAWFIIFTGSVAVYISKTGRMQDNRFITKIDQGGGFGDIALINDAPRTATIMTLEPTFLIKIEKQEYNRIIKFIHEKAALAIFNFIKKAPYFQTWSAGSLKSLSAILREETHDYGKVIVNQGDEIQRLFIIRTGVCSVLKKCKMDDESDPELTFLGLLEPLQYFCEETVLHEGETKCFSSVTIIAGDYRLRNIKRSASKVSKNVKLAKTIVSLGPTAAAATSLDGCETVNMTDIEARQMCKNIITLHRFTRMTDEEVREMRAAELNHKQWMQMRKVEMTRLLQERHRDPNLTIDIVRREAALNEDIKTRPIKWAF